MRNAGAKMVAVCLHEHVDIAICPWHRQKMRGGGVDIHSYPRRMCKSGVKDRL